MQDEILSVAPGYDLSPATERIDVILIAARVEVELNLAKQLSKFELREI